MDKHDVVHIIVDAFKEYAKDYHFSIMCGHSDYIKVQLMDRHLTVSISKVFNANEVNEWLADPKVIIYNIIKNLVTVIAEREDIND